MEIKNKISNMGNNVMLKR